MAKNDDVKQILKEYAGAFTRACDDSRKTLIETLKPGAKIPDAGKIYGDAFRDQFIKTADEYKGRALKIIDDEIRTVNARLAEAPSTDAVNSISLLAMRQNVTIGEVERLLNTYGSNAQAYDAIKDIAYSKGIKGINNNPIAVKAEMLADARHNIEKTINISEAERGHANDGYLAIVGAMIDGALAE